MLVCMGDGRAAEKVDHRIDSPTTSHRDLESRMIDVTRALAIMLVLLVHTALMVVSPAVSPVSVKIAGAIGILNLGAAGVALFFVISGYLLNMIYSRGDFAPRKFWVRRFGRIYPAWLFWTAIAVVATFIPSSQVFSGRSAYGTGILPDSIEHVGTIVLHLVFLGFLVPAMWNSFIPGGWSIQAEMFNYALYPLIRKSRFWVVLVVVLGLEVVHFAIVLIPIPIPGPWAAILATYLTSPVWFVVGVFLSRVTAAARGTSTTGDLPLEASLVAGVLAFAVLAGLGGPFVSQATSLAVIVGAIAVSYGIVRTGRWKPFIPIGKYSYGIYFSHLLFITPLAWAVARITKFIGPAGTKVLAAPMVVIVFVTILGLSFLVARVVFELVERRPLEWARRYPRRGSPASGVSAATEVARAAGADDAPRTRALADGA
jgi:exopolysaccharide production protein ExoZ